MGEGLIMCTQMSGEKMSVNPLRRSSSHACYSAYKWKLRTSYSLAASVYNIKATASSLPQDASAIANLFMASISLDLALSGRATYVQRVYVSVCM